MERAHSQWVIAASFLVAFMLAAVPLPEWANLWRPAWVAMVLLYWCLALPQRVGVVTGWMLGLFLDVLTGSLLGQNAAGLALVAYCAVRVHPRIRVFPLGQQALFVGVVLGVYLSAMIWLRFVTGPIDPDARMLASVLSSMLLWPWLFIVLRDVRRRFHVT